MKVLVRRYISAAHLPMNPPPPPLTIPKPNRTPLGHHVLQPPQTVQDFCNDLVQTERRSFRTLPVFFTRDMAQRGLARVLSIINSGI